MKGQLTYFTLERAEEQGCSMFMHLLRDCGKQVYLGGFDIANAATRAYDRAAIKFRGVDADINFTIADYDDDMIQMKDLTKEEFVHISSTLKHWFLSRKLKVQRSNSS